jgi:hypothetical protein
MDSTDEQEKAPGRDPEEYDWTKRSVWSMLLEFVSIIVFCAIGLFLMCYGLAVIGADGSGRLPWAP